MSDAALVSRMELIAANAAYDLYYDNTETQQFYLYNKSTKTAQVQTSVQAQAWLANASWQLPGLAAWGYQTENNSQLKNFPPS